MIRTNLLTNFVKKICEKSPVSSLFLQNLLKYDFSRLVIKVASIN